MQRISGMTREQPAYADALKHDLARGPASRPGDPTQARLKAANAEVNDGFLLLKAAEEQTPLQGSAPEPFNKTHIVLLPSRAVYYADTTERPLFVPRDPYEYFANRPATHPIQRHTIQ